MRRLTMILAPWVMLALVAAGPLLAQSKADREAIERAVLDYVEGVYEAKPELIERSVHPELEKFGFARRSADDAYRVLPMNYEQLVELAGSWNADGSHADADSPKGIDLLDVLDQTASAKLTAVWGIDYMHLAKYDGQWKIVQILWQTHPE